MGPRKQFTAFIWLIRIGLIFFASALSVVAAQVSVGSTVKLSVTADGTAPFSYQWKKNGVNLVGSTGATLTLANIQSGDAGSYSVVVANSAGSTTSDISALTVVAPVSVAPTITTQPLSQSVLVGTTVTLTAAASGSPAPTYQWKKGGVDIPGATSATLTLSNAQSSATGVYTMVATNRVGSVTTASANLVVSVSAAPVGFDTLGYLSRNPDVAAVVGSDLNAAWQHYYLYGCKEGRVFDEVFRVDEYLGMYGDLQAAFANNWQGAMMHWLTYGRAEGRLGRVPVTFDVSRYLALSPDLQSAFRGLSGGPQKAAAWNHDLNFGVIEGRTDGDFEVRKYLAQYADLRQLFGGNLDAAALHWYTIGRYEGRRILSGFDVQGYLARNSDVMASYGRDLYGAWLHYWNYGLNEGRVYDDLFRVDNYLARYADLRAAFGTDRQAALMHWLLYGKAEGRIGR